MYARWDDFERTFAAMDELRRRMEQAFGGFDSPFDAAPDAAVWPQTSLHDEGSTLVLRADVPGLRQEDLDVQLTADVLTISGERKLINPEGYSVHRQERRPFRFSRSFTLPTRVDGEKITAKLENGVLTVAMPKVPESQPRRISVRGG